MKRCHVLFVGLLLCAVTTAPVAAHAFGFSGLGARLGYVSPEDMDGTMHLGGHAEFERSGSRFHLQPSIMYWKEDGLSSLNGNFDGYYHFNAAGLTSPYLGAGVGVFNNSVDDGGSDTELGLNVFGGLRFPGPAAHYFIEGRYSASEMSQTSILGGVTFHMR